MQPVGGRGGLVSWLRAAASGVALRSPFWPGRNATERAAVPARQRHPVEDRYRSERVTDGCSREERHAEPSRRWCTGLRPPLPSPRTGQLHFCCFVRDHRCFRDAGRQAIDTACHRTVGTNSPSSGHPNAGVGSAGCGAGTRSSRRQFLSSEVGPDHPAGARDRHTDCRWDVRSDGLAGAP